MDWSNVEKIRGTVERYYLRNSAAGNVNIPKYDLFVTELRKDFEKAGFDLNNESDLYKLWAHLSLTCAAGVHIIQNTFTPSEALHGAVHVFGVYGNMTGLFLREMTKNCPSIPAAVAVPELPSE